ncbi:MAG: putative MarR family transcriptional regulator [Actinomycetia bacterium]|jgi:DNA-binding MarR family transcriptional regulator|nr:putative MarR family transcriptional regulator [Actinomycetes bacterium]MDQ1652807.1 MarR family transcriptional regulator, organic hydroperoxide resistance regulator [Cryptosporangiaceae bacterium]
MAETAGLDRQICFSLYAASRAVTGLYRQALGELGLTYPQYLVLLVLWQRGEISVGDLGAALALDSGTLSPLLKRLEAHGLVDRSRGAADERTVLVRPTAAGLELRERATGLPDRLASAIGLAPAEFRQLQDLLDRVRAAATSHPL